MEDVRNLPNFEPNHIDYRKFTHALDYYEAHGYGYIDVPWVVSQEATNTTLPADRIATSVQYGDLVGSAEQSFVELMMRGRAITKACAITPCFRMEDTYDELHHAYFMKLELINTKATQENLEATIRDAHGYFSRYTDSEIISTGPDMYDIIDAQHKIELGSYGIRLCGDTPFIYGTGLALPRLDTVLALGGANGSCEIGDPTLF